MTIGPGNARGLTLTEVAVVMILGTMIMAGLVGFYLSSQGLWLDASTQAITQREATLVAAAMRDSIRKSELTNYVGSLSRSKLAELNHALKMALDLG